MRRAGLVGAVVLAGLALAAGPAWAKGPLEICGAHRCVRLADEARPAINVSTPAGRVSTSPATPAPFFSIRYRDQPGSPLAYWVPSANILRIGYQRAQWVRPSNGEATLLRVKTRNLGPKPAPARVTVGVDVEPVEGDLSYLRLFSIGKAVARAVDTGGWLKILVFGSPTPWTDGRNALWISRRGSFLRRDGQLLAVDEATAERVRARLPLDTT